jgi:EAL domain-containing protein (putative c-di-GMP-specific phosphodiesterase class I)
MSLQQLVDHFNNNFEQERQCDFRPFVLKDNQVTGIFGIAHIKSEFIPIRTLFNTDVIAGYAAQAFASTDEVRQVKTAKIKKLLTKTLNKPAHVPSIVSFDRLCRTVHLLNYLALAKHSHFLVTEVDPRHILGVPYNHGAYFEQVIVHAGLKTQDVVISMTITGVHQLHYPQLLKGLTNYRDCGYKIALNLGYLLAADKAIELIKQLSPDYIIVNSPNENYSQLGLESILLESYNHLRELMSAIGGKVIMQHIEQPEQIIMAKMAKFDLVLGNYYQEFSWPNKDVKLKQDVPNYDYADSVC